MTTKQSILNRLTEAVGGTEKNIYTDEQLNEFAGFYVDKWDENTSEDVIAESFLDYWWNTEWPCRRCSECGELMTEGYCIENGMAYYCSEKCLHKNMTEEEYLELYDDGEGDTYWTEWE